jgi:hypothetical protein
LERMVAKNRAHRVGSGSYYVEKNDVTLVTDVTDVTVVTDVTGEHGNSFASRSVTNTETCHGDVTGTDGVDTPQNGSVTSVTTFLRDSAQNVVTQGDAGLIVPLESVPAEVLPRSEWTHEPTAEDIVVAHDPSHATAPWCIVVRNTGRRLGRFLTRSAALQEARTLRNQEV